MLKILICTMVGSSFFIGVRSQALYQFVNDMPKSGLGCLPIPLNAPTWQSKLVNMDADGHMSYHPDADGFIIPDFSHAGYRDGDEVIPEVEVVKTIGPVAGDNTKNIQKAIDEVGALPKNANGIRGALLLKKGLYVVRGPIYINYSGVVVRGEGMTGDPNTSTIIYDDYRDPVGISRRPVLVLGNTKSDNWNKNRNNEERILDSAVPVGSAVVHISQNLQYKPGDLVCIYHPSTEKWLAAIKYGEVVNAKGEVGTPWDTTTAPIYYHRYVTSVKQVDSATEITLDAPVFYTLQKDLSQSVIYRFTSNSYQRIGLENLRVDIANKGIPDVNHAWDGIKFSNAENCWARNVSVLHFGQAGFVTTHSTRITIESCYSLDPVGIVQGGMGYNFNTATWSQLILFKNCYARGGRHNYVSNGTSTVSGCVVYDCKSEGSRTTSEGHRIWSQGMLFDRYEDFNPITSGISIATLGFYNRMNWGANHGWGMVHGVMWNCNLRSPQGAKSLVYCEKPPTAQNYAIGCYTRELSDVTTFTKSIGYVEGTNKGRLLPSSLYEAQLKARALPGIINK